MNIKSNENVLSTPRLALACAVLAVLFCVLLYDSVFRLIPLGLNIPLYLVSFYAMLGIVFGKKLLTGMGHTALHLIFIALLSCTFVLFNDPLLLTINAILIVLLTGEQVLLSLNKTDHTPYSMRMIGDSLALWFALPLCGVRGAFSQYQSSKSKFSGVLIGVAIAIPVLFVIVPLLMSGDAVFHQFFMELFGGIKWGDVVGNLLVALLLFVLFSGLFWSLTIRKPGGSPNAPSASPPAQPKKAAAFNTAASLVLLCVLGTVLFLFCLIQCMYLFSGQVPAGLTYADYARSGFWQLLAVALIVIALVFFLLRFSAPYSRTTRNVQRILLALVLLCTLILLLSSFSRMTLYEQSFGFSQLRLFTQFFMVALFAFLVISILRLWIKRIDLKKCACFCFLICYTVLAFFNINAFIARENVKNQGYTVDISYLTTLGPDALPYYVDRLDLSSLKTTVIKAEATPAFNDMGDRVYRHLFDDQYLVFANEDALQQAYFLCRINRDLQTSDNWRFFNTGRNEARAALASAPLLTETLDQISEAFAQRR